MRSSGLAVVATLATIGASAQAVSAETGNHARPAFAKADLGDVSLKGLHFTPASASDRQVSVMLELQGQPVALHEAAAKENGKKLSAQSEKAIRDDLKSQQDQIKPGIAKAGGRVVAQLQWAYNGVQVHVAEKDVAQLASLPGVTAVHQMHTFEPSNVNGVPFVGGPQTWEDTGNTGKGIKVAVIDTGIDYTHADFGGPGTVEAFQKAAAASAAPAIASMFGPSAPKVKGGYDFVGDDYNAKTAGSVPAPDPNPLDCNGHGSHTAGTIAGYGVLDGASYHGPYKANTVSGNKDWNVGPGVAPEADLYAYRVFGCDGSSDIVASAIDQAMKDGVDVINMSLGSPFGGTDDPTSVAAENAAKAGIAVIASAGNSGNNAYLVGSPGTADHVLSVAALDGSLKEYPGAALSLTKADSVGAVDTIVANGAALPTGSLPVKVLRNADGTISLGCDPAEYTKAGVEGMLVVTRRGSCARVARAVFGQKAGAAAVLMINNSDSLPPYEGPITENPDTGQQYDVTIPFLGAAATKANIAALTAADGGTVSMTGKPVANTGYEQAASFTSGGPRNPDSAPKPEVTAPGVSVASVGVGTGNGYAIMSGTSMAAPMTAGVAALVKQAHPLWKGDQIKAAIQNTADPSLNQGYDGRLAGTGAVQAQKAVDSTVLAATDNGLNSLAFGFVPGSGDYTATRSFTLTNTGTDVAVYDLAVEANGNQRGAAVTVSQPQVKLAGGDSTTVDATLSMSAADFAALPSDDTSAPGPGQVMTIRGAVVATPESPADGQQTLRMAYLMVPRGLSDVKAGTPATFKSTGADISTFRSTLPVTNTGIHTGAADVYSWGIADAKGDVASGGTDVRAAGVQVLPGSVLAAPDTDRSLVFVVNNWSQAATQAATEYDIVIDNDHDGRPDYYVIGIDLGAVTTGEFNGIPASVVVDANTGKVIDEFLAEAPMNGSVIELPAIASEIGVTDARSGFAYAVSATSLLDDALVDRSGSTSFDAFRPPVETGQYAELAPGKSAELSLTLDIGKARATKTRGWLVVSVDDASGDAQADTVPVPSNVGQGPKGR